MRTRLLLVTGLSGAGKSSALRALEDVGYEAIDNLPMQLWSMAIARNADDEALARQGARRAVAIGVDTRTRGFSAPAFVAEVKRLRARDDVETTVLFLRAEEAMLARRFTETRRRHPMAVDKPLPEGVARERAVLEPVARTADVTLDTTDMSLTDLRYQLTRRFARRAFRGVTVTVQSFSYRIGLPREADIAVDVRFLSNPYWRKELRALTGRDKEVCDYVMSDPGYEPFFTRFLALIMTVLPAYHRECKSYLTIAVGCTGGRHRSVCVAERLADALRDQGFDAGVHHRDLPAR